MRSIHDYASRRLVGSDSGNVAILFAFALPVILIAVGVAIDFGNASQLRTRLNASADAAALAAVTPAEMLKTNAEATAAASNAFYGNVSALTSLSPSSAPVSISIVNPGGNPMARTATVSWSTTLKTNFGGFYGQPTLTISGTATASNVSPSPPNIDFYVLLDNSPSMALPASSAGIATLAALTTNSCAFACHEADSTDSNIANNPVVNGKHIDNYQVARNNGITLRLDEMTSGVTALMASAAAFANSQTGTIPAYRFAVDAMDSTYAVGFNPVMPLTGNYLTGWENSFTGFQLMQMFSENQTCVATTTGGVANPCGAGFSQSPNGSDPDTNYDDALAHANAQMPDPGNGTNVAGDSPQEVLFVVTDGLEDELSGSNRLIQAINANGAHNYCNDIKNRGIKIAILYTTYLPLPASGFYNTYVAPIRSQIAPSLQACATSGMFYEAGLDDNLINDFTTMFQLAMGQMTPRLTQ